MKGSLKKDIESYIYKIEELTDGINRLNATVIVLERDANLRDREMYSVKLLRKGKSTTRQTIGYNLKIMYNFHLN